MTIIDTHTASVTDEELLAAAALSDLWPLDDPDEGTCDGEFGCDGSDCYDGFDPNRWQDDATSWWTDVAATAAILSGVRGIPSLSAHVTADSEGTTGTLLLNLHCIVPTVRMSTILTRGGMTAAGEDGTLLRGSAGWLVLARHLIGEALRLQQLWNGRPGK